jgi:DNA-binding LytR/AlgR family response regulator
MNCIIIDDEPLAREAVQMLTEGNAQLKLAGSFGSVPPAAAFMATNPVDLIFLDIQMAGISGIDFAKTIHRETLIIFISAYSHYALDSYEVEAIDYLVKPLRAYRFDMAVQKALAYNQLLRKANNGAENNIPIIEDDYFFVKSNRKIVKVLFKDVLFIEGLKDYVVINTNEQKIITAINIKTIFEQLSKNVFYRISKSYIINLQHITSFDNNIVYIGNNKIPIGNAFRAAFFSENVNKRLIRR